MYALWALYALRTGLSRIALWPLYTLRTLRASIALIALHPTKATFSLWALRSGYTLWALLALRTNRTYVSAVALRTLRELRVKGDSVLSVGQFYYCIHVSYILLFKVRVPNITISSLSSLPGSGFSCRIM